MNNMADQPSGTESQTVQRAYTELFRNPARREALLSLLEGHAPLHACPDDVSHVEYRLRSFHNDQLQDLFLSTWAQSTAEKRFRHAMFQPSDVAASHVFHAELARETVDIMHHFDRSRKRRHRLEECANREITGKHLETVLVVAFALVHPHARPRSAQEDHELNHATETMIDHYMRNDVGGMLHYLGTLNASNPQRGQRMVDRFIDEIAALRVPKPLVLTGFDAVRNDTNLQNAHKAHFDYLRAIYEEQLYDETRDTRTRILGLLKRATSLLQRHKPVAKEEVKTAANESIILGRLSQMAQQNVHGKSFKR